MKEMQEFEQVERLVAVDCWSETAQNWISGEPDVVLASEYDALLAYTKELAQRADSDRHALKTLLIDIAAARASEGGWIEIKEGCEMPAIEPDSRTDYWEWSKQIRVVYSDPGGNPLQDLAMLSRCVEDGEEKFILDEGCSVVATHWKPLDWPSPPLSPGKEGSK